MRPAGPTPTPEPELAPGADLAKSNLSGRDLSGANLAGADLSGANLCGARLNGTDLSGANLSSCELLGADLEGARLDDCVGVEAGFGGTRLCGASLRLAKLSGATLSHADASDADFSGADLSGARLVETDLSRAHLERAQLRGADLSSCRVPGASFRDADLRESRLSGMLGVERAGWIGVDVREADFRNGFRLRRFILDENYLHEFRTQSRKHAAIHWLWWITSDCGRSFSRWSLWVLLVLCSFALIYQWVDVDYGEYATALSPIYFSVVTLTTLGYGDVLPASTAAQVVAIAEVTIGYLALGGLISIFANKLARRAE